MSKKLPRINREAVEATITVMAHGVLPMAHGVLPMAEAKDLFEDACLTTVVTCGPPPPTPQSVWHGHSFNPTTQNRNREAWYRRQVWVTEVENLLTERYDVPLANVGDFVIAFEMWCVLQKEDIENE